MFPELKTLDRVLLSLRDKALETRACMRGAGAKQNGSPSRPLCGRRPLLLSHFFPLTRIEDKPAGTGGRPSQGEDAILGWQLGDLLAYTIIGAAVQFRADDYI